MNARHADVIQRFGAVAHHARREQRFLRDGYVAGACGDHENCSFAGNFLAALDRDDAGQFVKLRVTRIFSAGAFHGCKNLLIAAGYQDVVARIFFPQHGTHNFRDLLRRLAFS